MKRTSRDYAEALTVERMTYQLYAGKTPYARTQVVVDEPLHAAKRRKGMPDTQSNEISGAAGASQDHGTAEENILESSQETQSREQLQQKWRGWEKEQRVREEPFFFLHSLQQENQEKLLQQLEEKQQQEQLRQREQLVRLEQLQQGQGPQVERLARQLQEELDRQLLENQQQEREKLLQLLQQEQRQLEQLAQNQGEELDRLAEQLQKAGQWRWEQWPLAQGLPLEPLERLQQQLEALEERAQEQPRPEDVEQLKQLERWEQAQQGLQQEEELLLQLPESSGLESQLSVAYAASAKVFNRTGEVSAPALSPAPLQPPGLPTLQQGPSPSGQGPRSSAP